jgi:hypothetical protein
MKYGIVLQVPPFTTVYDITHHISSITAVASSITSVSLCTFKRWKFAALISADASIIAHLDTQLVDEIIFGTTIDYTTLCDPDWPHIIYIPSNPNAERLAPNESIALIKTDCPPSKGLDLAAILVNATDISQAFARFMKLVREHGLDDDTTTNSHDNATSP